MLPSFPDNVWAPHVSDGESPYGTAPRMGALMYSGLLSLVVSLVVWDASEHSVRVLLGPGNPGLDDEARKEPLVNLTLTKACRSLPE